MYDYFCFSIYFPHSFNSGDGFLGSGEGWVNLRRAVATARSIYAADVRRACGAEGGGLDADAGPGFVGGSQGARKRPQWPSTRPAVFANTPPRRRV